MPGTVLILGGYGNFGKRIACALAAKGTPVIIAGRNREKAEALARQLPGAEVVIFDVGTDLRENLERLKPSVLINSSGPFQGSDYRVAELCIAYGIHYIDIADGRDFVTGISALDTAAKAKGVTVISGASTVPGLSSAVVETFRHEFSVIDSVRFGINPGQRTERGLATTRSILSYAGKLLRPYPGNAGTAYGWQNIHRQEYPGLGKRWMANCDIPDLDLLPSYYGIKSIRFSAGVELGLLHLGLGFLAWLVRIGLPFDLPRLAAPLLRVSRWFDRFGSADGGMHVFLEGRDLDGRPHTRRWFIIARNGDGPHIPTVPAVLLADKLARGKMNKPGSMPCVGLVELPDYLHELRGYAISTPLG